MEGSPKVELFLDAALHAQSRLSGADGHVAKNVVSLGVPAGVVTDMEKSVADERQGISGCLLLACQLEILIMVHYTAH